MQNLQSTRDAKVKNIDTFFFAEFEFSQDGDSEKGSTSNARRHLFSLHDKIELFWTMYTSHELDLRKFC